MNNVGTVLIIVLLAHPHVGEGGKRAQNSSASPDSELPVRAGNNTDIDGLWCLILNFFAKSLAHTFKHGGAARKDDVLVEFPAHVNVALLDGVVGQRLDGVVVPTVHLKRLEQVLRTPESLGSNGDYLSVRQLIILIQR